MNSFAYLVFIAFISSVTSATDKDLGSDCNESKDCLSAYTVCDKDSKKCVCLNGFKAQGSSCEPQKLACPTWDGVSSSKPGLPCEFRYDSKAKNEIHNCSNNEMCFIHPKTYTTRDRIAIVGHCCPKPPQNAKGLNVNCPFTVNKPTAVCLFDTAKDPIFVPDQILAEEPEVCSDATHACVGVNDKFACCPVPCPGKPNYFSFDKKCYECKLC